MDFKQAILVRQDLKLTKGKMAAQAAHAAVEATLRSDPATVSVWRREGMKKVVLKVPDKKTLLQYVQRAKDEGLITATITDAGRTHLEPGTMTCAAIGPADEEAIDTVTASLTLLS